MMNARFKHAYKKASSNPATPGKINDVSVYVVTGTPAELDAYKKAQGDRFVEDDKGNPLWFTTSVLPLNLTLGIATKSGKVYADTSEQDRIATLANQYPGALGLAIAQQGASIIMAKAFGRHVEEVAPSSPTMNNGMVNPKIDQE
jgi:hypothetical protein